jgi:hypothetical protein
MFSSVYTDYNCLHIDFYVTYNCTHLKILICLYLVKKIILIKCINTHNINAYIQGLADKKKTI